MVIELPDKLAEFLNFLGVPWININEDTVREFASHVRTFGSNLEAARQDSSKALRDLGAGYTGTAYETLVTLWAQKSAAHMAELVDGCGVLAFALDAGADYIALRKAEAIYQLGCMIDEAAAGAIATVATAGLSDVAVAGLYFAAEKSVKFAEDQITQHIAEEIFDRALKPLLARMENVGLSLLLRTEAAALGESGALPGTSFSLDPGAVGAQVAVLRRNAEAFAFDTTSFVSCLKGLNFR